MHFSNLIVGILGCGKISSCVVRGLMSTSESSPTRIFVSQRNENKARRLQQEFPNTVEIRCNEDIVRDSDVIFIGLLPATAREVLPGLAELFTGKLVVSMMATVDMQELLLLLSLPQDSQQIVRTVPLPSCARNEGPILVYPPHPRFVELLTALGTVVGCEDELLMKPMVALTGHISSFFELMHETQKFMTSEGVPLEAARTYTSSFYSSLARSTELTSEGFEELALEAATPGGINEQSMAFLKATEHFEAHAQSLVNILARLREKPREESAETSSRDTKYKV